MDPQLKVITMKVMTSPPPQTRSIEQENHIVKSLVTDYWEQRLRVEASLLSSLSYTQFCGQQVLIHMKLVKL